MNKLIAIGVAALFFAAAIPSASAERTDYVNYLPGLIVIGISCSGDQHEWVPTYTPDEETLQNNPIGWALSGEPECAPNDLMNTAGGSSNPGGFGAGAFTVFPGESLAVVNTIDEVFGTGQSWLSARGPESASTGEEDSSEGCGPQIVTIPADPVPHDQAPPDAPYYLVWGFVPEAGASDDLSVICFAAFGQIEATIS